MKKVGLAVVTYKDNFGSALQTYATQSVIREMGFQTGIFDISKINKSIQLRKIEYYLTRLIHKDERAYIIANMISSSKKKNENDEYARNMTIRHAKYQAFYSENIDLLPQANKWEELATQASECVAVVVGSDQLWGAANIAGGYFTLEFVPDNVKKIAYSTSFGVSSIPKQLHKHARRFLNRIDYLSVREVTGQKIIKDLTGRDIPVVCDPTMLLTAEEWMKIQSDKPFTDGEYILTYFMGENPEHRDFVKRLKEKTRYKIVGLLHGSTFIEGDEQYCDEAPYDVGPGEFLNLIKHAKYVCTDSFHCSVFSILFGTEFFSFPRDKMDSTFAANDRLYTLLGWTGLQDRMLTGKEDVETVLCKKLDNDVMQKLVAERRRNSLEYLARALNS